jgi:hypothetical protein
VPSPARAPCCFNFLAVSAYLPLSTTASHDCLPPRHSGRVSPASLSCNCPLFSGPQSSSVSNNWPLFNMTPGHSMLYGAVTKWMYSPMLACHTGGHFTPNPPTGFKVCENSRFILWLGLPVCCHQGCLAYLVVEVSLPSTRNWGWRCFSYFSLHCCSTSLCFIAVLSPVS